MTLDSIVGQAVPVAILKNGLASGTLGHAYLLAGEAGLGKETTARAAARELQKLGGPLSELYVLDGEGTIQIDTIRAMRQQAAYAKKGSQIWLILDADRMSTEAANAFLKTLEEPADNTYFFLTTTRIHDMLPTIVSRCQQLDFRPIPEGEICQWLAERTDKDPDDARIRLAARLARGSLGKAWEYWQGPLFEWRQSVLDKLIRIPQLDYAEVMGLSLAWPEDRSRFALELQWFKEWYRDLLVIKGDLALPLYNGDYKGELERISSYYTKRSLFLILDEITAMDKTLVSNARIRFYLGYLLLLMKKGALA
ncbi:MAG: AAA family ATPase [Limnochordia bacterium]